MPISQPTFQPGTLTFTGAQNTTITNLSLPTSGVEVSHVLQSNLKQLMIKARGNSKLQISFVSTESGTKYVSIPKGTVLNLDELTLASSILYIQASANSEVAEILELY